MNIDGGNHIQITAYVDCTRRRPRRWHYGDEVIDSAVIGNLPFLAARLVNLRDVFFRKHAIRCDRYLFGSLTKFNSKPYTIDLDGFCRYLIKDIHTMEAATVCRTRSLSLNCAILRPSITFSVKSTMPRVWTSKLEERHIYLVFARIAEREAVLWGSTYDYWEADTRNDKADTIAFARITERETILWGSTYDVGRGVFFFSN